MIIKGDAFIRIIHYRNLNIHYGYFLRSVFASTLFVLFTYFNLVNAEDAHKTNNSKTIKVLTVKHFPPHYSVDEKNQPQGFAIDTINAIAKISGLQIEYIVKDNWNQTADALQSGEGDLIPNLGISNKRLDNFDFSVPIETFPISIMVRAGSNNINSHADLSNRIIGAVKYNVGIGLAKKIPNITLKIFDQPENALFNLLSGHIDALVYPKSVALKIARDSGLEDKIRILKKPLKEIKRAVAVRKGNHQLLNTLNSAINQFTHTLEYEKIYTKWYGKEKPFWSVQNVIIASSVVLIFTILLLGIWKYYATAKLNKRLLTSIEERNTALDALRHSEVRFRTIFELAAIGVALIETKTSKLIRVNDYFCNMLGYSVSDIKNDRNYYDLSHPDDLQIELDHMERLLRNEIHDFNIQKRYLHKDGSEVWANVAVSSTWRSNDTPTHHIIVVEDISERIKSELSMRRAQKMDALGKLTGGIVHDYNNMLGIILGFTELLADEVSNNAKLKRYTENITHAAERNRALTSKLMVFSKHQAVETSVVNINSLLKSQQQMLQKTLTVRIQLQLELEENIWPVLVDSGDLEDAIINILINASHVIKGSGKVVIRTSNSDLNTEQASKIGLTPGRYVVLSITDDGDGINPDIIDKIFEPFFTTKAEQGTGLGLAQVYGFIKRSGGSINVESQLGEGATFNIYLPHYISSEHITSVPVFNQKHVNLNGNESILVVDDEIKQLELAKEILIKHGYRVFTANTEEHVFEVLKNHKIDLLLSDIIMPNINGYELASRILQQYPNIKVQLTSGYNENIDSEIIDETLRKNILPKPYTQTGLLTSLRTLLDANKPVTHLENKTALILDDDESARLLYKINLEKLGLNCLLAESGDQAIELYKEKLSNEETIDFVIVDLNLNNCRAGNDIAKEILSINSDAKIIVSSGDHHGPIMSNYRDYGFYAALRKDFDRKNIERILKG